MDYGFDRVGIMLRDMRISRHMTQHELSVKSGVDQAVILRIERGDTVPNLNTVKRMAHGMSYTLMMTYMTEMGDN